MFSKLMFVSIIYHCVCTVGFEWEISLTWICFWTRVFCVRHNRFRVEMMLLHDTSVTSHNILNKTTRDTTVVTVYSSHHVQKLIYITKPSVVDFNDFITRAFNRNIPTSDIGPNLLPVYSTRSPLQGTIFNIHSITRKR